MEITEFKSALDGLKTEVKSTSADLETKMTGRFDELATRLSAVETAQNFPGTVAAKAANVELEQKQAFANYLLNADNDSKKAEFMSKAVTVAGLTTAVPRVVSNDIIAAARAISPFSDLVLRKNGISPEFSQLLSNGATYELVGESTVRGSQEANLTTAKPIFTEISSVITLSKHALEDFGFNVVEEVSAMIADDLAVGMEQYLVTGTGTGVQNAGVLLGGTPVAAAGAEATVEDVLALIKAVKVGDAQMGTFVVNPDVYALLSDEKVNGQRIIDIKDSIDVIRGKRVLQSEWLDESTPALFGNFKRGFLAGTHIAGLDISLNPYKRTGFVDIEARLRFASCVMHSTAYAKLTVA